MKALAQRSLSLAGPIAPAIALALIPKCPVCFAAYLMAATGVGISVVAAVSLRVFLIVVCVGTLVFVAVKHIRNLRIAA